MMATRIAWYTQNRVLLMRFQGDVSADELSQINRQITQHLDESDAQLVHLILDQRDIGGVPGNIMTLTRTMTFIQHPRLGWVLRFGEIHPTVRFMSAVVMQAASVRFRNFHTLEEALQFLSHVDVTLNHAGDEVG
jgi:hypothetical protein